MEAAQVEWDVCAAGVGKPCCAGAVGSVSRYTKLQAGGFEHGVESPDRRAAKGHVVYAKHRINADGTTAVPLINSNSN